MSNPSCHPLTGVLLLGLIVCVSVACTRAPEPIAEDVVEVPVTKADEPKAELVQEPARLTDAARVDIMLATVRSNAASMHAGMLIECMMMNCQPKKTYAPAAVGTAIAGIRSEVVADYKVALRAAEGHPTLTLALKGALNRTTKFVDSSGPIATESLAGWRLRQSAMRAELDEALSIVKTELDLTN